MHVATPREPERYSPRLLLLHRKNIYSFEDLCTVGGTLFPSFTEATRVFDLLHNDTHYGDCLEEAVLFGIPIALRALFSYMLAFCDILSPQHLFDRFKMKMAEEFTYSGFSPNSAEAIIYYDLSDRLSVLQYNLADQIRPPSLVRPQLAVVEINREEHSRKGAEMYSCLNANQRAVANSILQSLDSNRRKLRFVDGPAGSGKTYLYNTIYHILKGRRKSVICVAWTGFAASLLLEGGTVSSTFILNMRAENRECSIKREDRDTESLVQVDVIIGDEISMVPKFSLDAVNVMAQDLMCNMPPFRGKTVVVGGYFRQTLPIVQKGRLDDMVDACIKNRVL
ncbi:hypothetical protein OESDEN_01927 [Oesophagostomum dentatum]|uniref:ATP-dependent DNA helicase n=1 Tax=Oesophagostomum dentatum TaxID=61180 RepID=A0A0B1TLG2_OESDE|nr:hypothetical protein OESDEN_01927 [Oesophagostomum dentatum]